MKAFVYPFIPIFMAAILALSPVEGICQSSIPEPPEQSLQSLIDELEKAIEDADRRMVAHPTFLDELRALIKKYQVKIRQVFFSDDFSDGDFDHSPRWRVGTGQFTVTADHRLRSQVTPGQAFSDVPSKGETDRRGEAVEILLKEILGAATKNDQQGKQEPPSRQRMEVYDRTAVIETNAPFAAAFEVSFSFLAEPSQGAMEIVLMGGEPAQPWYRLTYNASPSKERPIEIVRDSQGRSYVIQAADAYPMLEDGRQHRIQWIRDVQGNMSVVVDGQTVLKTVELYYSDSFSKLALVNRGGTYEWDDIMIMQPEAVTAR